MTDEQIIENWRLVIAATMQTKSPVIVAFAREIIKAERNRCMQICRDYARDKCLPYNSKWHSPEIAAQDIEELIEAEEALNGELEITDK